MRTLKTMLGIYQPGMAPIRLNPLRPWQKAFGFGSGLIASAVALALVYASATGKLPRLM